MLSMKKFWLIVSLWLLILTGSLSWAIRTYPDYRPTFPYHQITSHWPRAISTWSNFDGVNYLRLATHGYPSRGGEVAFFPLYPVLVRGLTNVGLDPLLSALLLSSFCLVLFFLLVRELYPRIASRFLLLFLSFPASFFLAGAYTESLFLLFFVLFVAALKRRSWWLAAFVAGLASGTRLVGAIFGIMLLLEYFRTVPKPITLRRYSIFFVLVLLSELGLLLYMFYLSRAYGDPLAFIHAQPQFGMGRSGGEIILLPQVLFRYVKMLLTVTPVSLLFWRVLWELVTFLVALWVLVKYWTKLTPTDRLYSGWVILLPTLSGTLSSFPRYALVALPLFFVLARHLKPRALAMIVITQTLLLIFHFVLFTRGLFVA